MGKMKKQKNKKQKLFIPLRQLSQGASCWESDNLESQVLETVVLNMNIPIPAGGLLVLLDSNSRLCGLEAS